VAPSFVSATIFSRHCSTLDVCCCAGGWRGWLSAIRSGELRVIGSAELAAIT
jgi:hypothetical protein